MRNMVRRLSLFRSSYSTKHADQLSKGPIIRVNPDEIYINDPEFIEEVYAGPTKKREKFTAVAKCSNRQSIAQSDVCIAPVTNNRKQCHFRWSAQYHTITTGRDEQYSTPTFPKQMCDSSSLLCSTFCYIY